MHVVKYQKGVPVELTPHFKSTEMDCHCKDPECDFTLIDLDHIIYLEKKRSELKRPIRISSGYRCLKHNRSIGSTDKSQHPKGTATDITSSDPNADGRVFDDAQGLGIYPGKGFIHVDSRNGYRARWSG